VVPKSTSLVIVLLRHDILGAVIAVAKSGTFVPMATSFSPHGAAYSVAVGEAIPPRWIPNGIG
jgi:hypothetical protein